MNGGVIIGADPELARKLGVPLLPGTAEFPCQTCGRKVLLAEEAARLALGDPVSVVPFVLEDGEIKRTGPPEINAEPVTVVCMFCAFADKPDVLAKLKRELSK